MPEKKEKTRSGRTRKFSAKAGLRPAPNAWHPEQELFPPLAPGAMQILERLPYILESVRPLKVAHKKDLPADIGALSKMLTSRRGDLRISYWSSPAFVSAYLYYFLPWNLIRLGRLFQGLRLPPPTVEENAPPLLLDAGAGPLTVPIALWLARPEWRDMPIHILALDTARQPLDLGAKILAAIAGKQKAWRITLACGPIQALASHRRRTGNARPWLITAANILNELKTSGGRSMHEDAEDYGAHPHLTRLMEAWAPLWDEAAEDAPGPCALFVEPGTRQGGTTIMRMRALALEMGLSALEPCVRDETCPLLEAGEGTSGSYAKMWCHFTFSADAPAWLKHLSSSAGLCKQSLSISPLLLSAAGMHESGKSMVRVLSQPFAVPSLAGQARYGCSDGGLALLQDAACVPCGSLVASRIVKGKKDLKTGVPILQPPAHIYGKNFPYEK